MEKSATDAVQCNAIEVSCLTYIFVWIQLITYCLEQKGVHNFYDFCFQVLLLITDYCSDLGKSLFKTLILDGPEYVLVIVLWLGRYFDAGT